MQKSKIHSFRSGRAFASGGITISTDDVKRYAQLSGIGITLPNSAIRSMMSGLDVSVMDGNDTGVAPAPLAGVTTPSIAAQIQFLQAWLPGFVRVITAARKIDELVGLTTVGAFEDEEVIQGVLEPLGVAVPYGDHTNIPLSSWNLNWERRTIVRFEQGMEVGYLEELRSARVRVSTAAEKRGAAALGLEIQRNRVGFYGFNAGLNRTYGFLNDPALPAYVNVPNGAGGSPLWSQKTFTEIAADIRSAISALRVASKDTIDPAKTKMTLAVGADAVDFLSVFNELGSLSVMQWLRETYPNIRVVSAPELDDANGGVGVMYLYAEQVDDGASDDSKTFAQLVPAKFLTLGVDKRAKTYVEDYANATAGVMLKRPYAVVRRSGIS